LWWPGAGSNRRPSDFQSEFPFSAQFLLYMRIIRRTSTGPKQDLKRGLEGYTTVSLGTSQTPRSL
jgi:hypothetical protein